jgi:hypothetical protein
MAASLAFGARDLPKNVPKASLGRNAVLDIFVRLTNTYIHDEGVIRIRRHLALLLNCNYRMWTTRTVGNREKQRGISLFSIVEPS